MLVLRARDGQASEILGFLARTESPRTMVFRHIEGVATSSQILFDGPSNYRIGGFHQDSNQDWARTLNMTKRGGQNDGANGS